MPGVKKEPLVATKGALPSLTKIGKQELQRDDAIFFLGLMAAKSLLTIGQVTLIMGADEDVCIANPTQVYLGAGAIIDDGKMTEIPDFKWVRPILPSGRPQYAAWRDGELWEIEFIDEEPEEKTSDSDHQ